MAYFSEEAWRQHSAQSSVNVDVIAEVNVQRWTGCRGHAPCSVISGYADLELLASRQACGWSEGCLFRFQIRRWLSPHARLTRCPVTRCGSSAAAKQLHHRASVRVCLSVRLIHLSVLYQLNNSSSIFIAIRLLSHLCLSYCEVCNVET